MQVGKGKEGCGRVVARRQLGIVNAYTLEASFMGADQVGCLQLRHHEMTNCNMAESREDSVV